jgi:hypothetical protein
LFDNHDHFSIAHLENLHFLLDTNFEFFIML